MKVSDTSKEEDILIFKHRLAELIKETAQKSIADKSSKVTQNSVAESAGMAKSTISKYLDLKKSNNIKLTSAIRLARYFNVSMDYLCGLTDDLNAPACDKVITRELGLSNKLINACKSSVPDATLKELQTPYSKEGCAYESYIPGVAELLNILFESDRGNKLYSLICNYFQHKYLSSADNCSDPRECDIEYDLFLITNEVIGILDEAYNKYKKLSDFSQQTQRLKHTNIEQKEETNTFLKKK